MYIIDDREINQKKIIFNIEYVVASVLRQANLVPQDGGVFTLGLTHLNS